MKTHCVKVVPYASVEQHLNGEDGTTVVYFLFENKKEE